jgi:multidrug resistance efflux pump
MPTQEKSMSALRPALVISALAVLLVLAGCAQKPADPPGQAQGAAGTPAAGPQGAARPGSNDQQGQGGGRRFATIPVQAVTVQNGTLVTDNETAGTVTAVTQSSVAAQVAGVVLRVVRTQGDWVKQGALVVQLDDAALKLALKNAQLALENAKINLTVGQQTSTESGPKLSSQLDAAKTAYASAQKTYEAQKKQFDLGGISSSQLDNAQSALQQAQANVMSAQLALDQNSQAGTQTLAQTQLTVDQATVQLEIAQLNLQNASITAPFAGQISAINVTPGSYVSLNTAVFVLVSTDKQVNFTVPPADAPDFKTGDHVQFTYSGRPYTLRISQSPSAPVNGVVPMVARLPVSVPASYGAVGTVGYKLNVATGLLIPIDALVTRADQNLVYAVAEGKAVEQPITIVAEAGTTAVVKGVQPGAQIIINPPPGLLAGAIVQVVGQQAGAPQQAGPQRQPPGAPSRAAPGQAGKAGAGGSGANGQKAAGTGQGGSR